MESPLGVEPLDFRPRAVLGGWRSGRPGVAGPPAAEAGRARPQELEAPVDRPLLPIPDEFGQAVSRDDPDQPTAPHHKRLRQLLARTPR